MIHQPHWPHPPHHDFDPFAPLRRWLDGIEVKNQTFARFICRFIPKACPFERDVTFLGHTVHIPALCELNPLYDELVALRFRALTYLANTAP